MQFFPLPSGLYVPTVYGNGKYGWGMSALELHSDLHVSLELSRFDYEAYLLDKGFLVNFFKEIVKSGGSVLSVRPP